MPRFRVEALEKFVVRTIYHVKAKTPDEAEALCKSGKNAYEESAIQEGGEEWIETLSIESCNEQPRRSKNESHKAKLSSED